jgi:ABC-type cobalamin/Fe3+-siderophores transport system ATPase subunit
MIQIKDLFIIYPATPTNVVANRGISIEIPDSGLVLITGPNGSGKSTLLKVLAGELEASAGEFRINNQLIDRKTLTKKLSSLVHFLPQDFNLGTSLERSQEQLAGIDKALSSEKPIVLLDEPTKYLNSSDRKNLLTLLKKLSRKRTFIIASHDSSWAKQFGTSIHIQNGRVVQRTLDSRKRKVEEEGWRYLGKIQKPESLNNIRSHKNIVKSQDLAEFLQAASTDGGTIFDPDLSAFHELTINEFFWFKKIRIPENLINFSGKRIRTLSGGEKTWVYLYFLLSNKPKRIFLLYPSLNLDSVNQVRLHDLILKLANSGSKITLYDID